MMRKQVEEAIQTRKSEIHKYGKTDLWVSGVNKWRYGVEVDGILSSYHNLRKLKDSHASSINEETKSREISKMEIFNKSKMKNSLRKSNGYESELDMHTFQSDVLKIHQ